MKIGIDARMYSQSGIGRYIRNLLNHLQKLDTKNDYYIFLQKSEYEAIELNNNFHKVLADIAWYGFAEQIKFPKLLNAYKLDVVHFPHFNVPMFYRGKFIVTIHDLIHQNFAMKRATTHGKLTYLLKKNSYKFVFKNAVSRSIKVIVPSVYVQNSLIKKWKVDKEKILITPEAVDEKIISIANKMQKNKSISLVQELGVDFPYLFYIGNAHPHKNVENLINVFVNLKKKYPQLNLVLSGDDHYFWRKIKKEIQDSSFTKEIIFTGYVTDEQAVALYKNAVCYILPSLEEGFGIPLLEAMACKCPVVSSNAGSLAEVGNNACIYFDPKDQDEMYKAIEKVLKSESIRQSLIEKGKNRYKQFNWERLANQTLEVYQQ